MIENKEETDRYNKWKNILSLLITAIGNFSVQYNYQAMSVALKIMSESVCTTNDDACKDGEQAKWLSGTIEATIFAGSIVGQLTMGYAGDILGRNRAMTLTLTIAAVSALLTAIVPRGSSQSIYLFLIVFRFTLGIGVGGVYPLSATKAAEDGAVNNGKASTRSASIAFFWQVPGAMTPWIIAYCMVSAGSVSTDLRWRLILGIGAIPALMVVCLSLLESYKVKENRSYTEESVVNFSNNNNHVNDNRLSWYQLLRYKIIWIKIIATGGTWFLFDVYYYGVNLFGGEILDAMKNDDDDSISSDKGIQQTAYKQMIALGMGIPATLFAIYMLTRVSTKTLQIYSFSFVVVCFILMAACFVPLKNSSPDGLLALYCLLLFSLSSGVNVTTYILPAEIYPKRVRGTFNGIAAAMGKLGAVFGSYAFGALVQSTGFPTIMLLCAGVAAVGAVVTFVFIEEDPNKIQQFHDLCYEEVLEQRFSRVSMDQQENERFGEGVKLLSESQTSENFHDISFN